MGGYISSFHNSGKLVLPNGTVRVLERPITAAELMLEHPQTYVVEFDPNSYTKLLPLPADYNLNPNKAYLVIPMARGRANGVSIEEARRIILGARETKIPPLFGMCMARNENGPVMAERIEKVEDVELESEGFKEKTELLCRQYSSKGWKPSLGTIEERNYEKMRHWLF